MSVKKGSFLDYLIEFTAWAVCAAVLAFVLGAVCYLAVAGGA